MKVHNPNNLPTKPISDLLPTQGELKDLSEKNYNKLKNRILERGFIVPVFVWEDDKGVLHLLDGHQRQRVFQTEGWTEEIPYLKVPAKDMQEAMAKLLEITSQYGTITQEGVDAFVATYELNEAEMYEATSFDATNYLRDQQEAIDGVNELDEWQGMPEFVSKDNPLKVIIQFENETDRQDFVDLKELKIAVKGKQAWSTYYPYREREDLTSQKYE